MNPANRYALCWSVTRHDECSSTTCIQLTLCNTAGHRLQQLAVKNEVPLWEGSDDGSTSGEEGSGKSVSGSSGRCCRGVLLRSPGRALAHPHNSGSCTVDISYDYVHQKTLLGVAHRSRARLRWWTLGLCRTRRGDSSGGSQQASRGLPCRSSPACLAMIRDISADARKLAEQPTQPLSSNVGCSQHA